MHPALFERLPESLVRAIQHAEVRRTTTSSGPNTPQLSPALSVALSREVGARATEVAQEIGKRLGWAVYDHELLERLASEMNVRVGLIESVDERHVSWLQEALEQVATAQHASESSYVVPLVETVTTLATYGHCVIVGRGAAMFLPSNTVLRVRLIAPRESRIARVALRKNCDPDEAEKYVEKTDRQRIRFIKDHFHKDATDPQHYDLVINTSRVAVEDAAELIVTALQRMESSIAKTGWQDGEA
jgi:cytidylate kinase